MKELNIPPFYIGQKVIFITDDYDGRIYYLKSTLPIGSVHSVIDCFYDHNTWEVVVSGDPNKVYKSSSFAPIEETFQSISLEKILEEETKLVSAN